DTRLVSDWSSDVCSSDLRPAKRTTFASCSQPNSRTTDWRSASRGALNFLTSIPQCTTEIAGRLDSDGTKPYRRKIDSEVPHTCVAKRVTNFFPANVVSRRDQFIL